VTFGHSESSFQNSRLCAPLQRPTLITTIEFSEIEIEEVTWLEDFLEEYEADDDLGASLVSRRDVALTKVPSDKFFFLPINRDCLHLIPETKISFLKLIQHFKDLGPKEEICSRPKFCLF
jgi:hypothetical protein